MDTNSRKETRKKWKAFCYRLITIGSCLTMLGTALLGREALVNLYQEGMGTITGDIYYLTEFREYISLLYTKAMIGTAGIGDDTGFPIHSEDAEKLKSNALTNFNAAVADARQKEDMLYYVEYNHQLQRKHNVNLQMFSDYDDHLLLPDHMRLVCYWNGPKKELFFFPTVNNNAYHTPEYYYTEQYRPNSYNTDEVRLVLALKNTGEYNSPYFKELQECAENYRRILILFFSSAALFIVFGLLGLFSRKRRKQALITYSALSAKLWIEAKLLGGIGLIVLCYHLHLWHFNGTIETRTAAIHYAWLYVPTGILLYLLYVDLCSNKGSHWTHSLSRALLQFLRNYQDKLAGHRKASNMHIVTVLSGILLILAGVVLIGTNFLKFGILTGIVGVLLLLCSIRLKHFIADAYTLSQKLSDLRVGKENTTTIVSKKSLLKQSAEDLDAVEEGIAAAIEQSNRSNQMRVELITNVSHDLKTPLTSIINYADLLCEENLPGPADEYAASLRTKAYRLKSMVQDVFELSKATSGNLPIEKTTLDLAKLVCQTLADMDEKIQDSTLTFKLNIITEPLMIEADGEKLYRVFQNLIVNALQYSLENSRVYVTLDAQDGYAIACIKNTSRDELNFKPEEIVERFVRNDTSRTTEGSGLGLSIVQSFTEACGGTFSIALDADLFTAGIRFPLAAPEQEGDN